MKPKKAQKKLNARPEIQKALAEGSGGRGHCGKCRRFNILSKKKLPSGKPLCIDCVAR